MTTPDLNELERPALIRELHACRAERDAVLERAALCRRAFYEMQDTANTLLREIVALRDGVRELREAQKRYFRTHLHGDLMALNGLEKQVDELLANRR